ncbi:hypothetical protein [Methanobacterium formicicum]|nr:hypothetical protein [Methanobacterium formicicum]
MLVMLDYLIIRHCTTIITAVLPVTYYQLQPWYYILSLNCPTIS